MYPKISVITAKNAYEYQVKIGEITDDKLSGVGKLVCNYPTSKKSVTLGHFKDDVLEGVGCKFEKDECVEYGFYSNGELVNEEEFIKRAKLKIGPGGEVERVKRTFHESKMYYEGDENNLNGFVLVVYKNVQIPNSAFFDTFITYKEYRYYVNNKPVDFIYYYYNSNDRYYGIKTKHEYTGESEMFAYVMNNIYFGYPCLLEEETFRIEEGIETLKENSISLKGCGTIYLPKSIKKLEQRSVKGRGYYLLEVYYPGTKEEWEDIEKGESVYTREEDYYGSYYHNSPGYITVCDFRDWAIGAVYMIIHCSDGIIYTSDKSKRS